MHQYAHQCGALAQELAESLSESEVETLRSRLEGLATSHWAAWRDRHKSAVAEFVAATPSQRKKKKAWQAPRLELTLAGFQHCIEAQILLEEIDNRFLSPGGPYRAMASKAGLAYRNIRAFGAADWPWDGDPPFAADDD